MLNSVRVFLREFFVFHHKSLEFRAKMFASLAGINSNSTEYNIGIIKEVSAKIYHDDLVRQDILLRTILEYVKKIKHSERSIDNMIFDIDQNLKKYPRYYKKIELKHLVKFKQYNAENSNITLQTRVLEFFEHSRVFYEKIYKGKKS